MTASPSLATAADVTTDGSPELDIVRDVARRAWPVPPVLVLLAGLLAGFEGALSAAIGVGLVAANLVIAAATLSWAARISLGVLMGVALGGYAVRIGAMFGVVFAIKDLDAIHLPSLGVTLIVTHLGLLLWELQYVSASLAHPGLKPSGHKASTAPETFASKERAQ